MADLAGNLNYKRPKKENDQPESENKRQKMNQQLDVSESSGEATELNTMTNICYELLNRIFDLLDLESLMNVAQTCKRLQIAAAAKFADKCCDELIIFWPAHQHDQKIFKINSTIYCVGIKVCLPLLRCFGPKISNLLVMHTDDFFDQYLNQFCADTLIGISFDSKSKLFVDSFTRKFQNVEKICIENSSLGKHLPDIVNWFPNLRHLKIDDVIFRDNFNLVCFPHLEHLSITFTACYDLVEKAVNLLLLANRQLQGLKVFLHSKSRITIAKLLDMISGNILISKLEIENSNCGKNMTNVNVSASELSRLANEHPVLVELTLSAYSLTADVAIAFIGQLPLLNSFEFRIKGNVEYDRLLAQLDGKWKHIVVDVVESEVIYRTIKVFQ